LLEVITVFAVRQGAQSSALLAAIMHPELVMKTIERALQHDGTTERMMLHKAVGFASARG
jgi:hypothetical protein